LIIGATAITQAEATLAVPAAVVEVPGLPTLRLTANTHQNRRDRAQVLTLSSERGV
jgi:hypothetical protein